MLVGERAHQGEDRRAGGRQLGAKGQGHDGVEDLLAVS